VADALTFNLLKWQRQLLNDKTRFKVVVAGRRCGKSRFAIVNAIIKGLECPDATAGILYVAPTQQMARVLCWDLLNDLGRPVIASANISNSEIKLINGVKIYVRGADHPDSLRGMKLYYAISDEHKDVKDDVWPMIVRPALSDMKGGALIIGTPAPGESQFKDLYELGQSGIDPEWMSIQLTTYDNELIDPHEIESARKLLSDAMFRQEYMATFENVADGILDVTAFKLWPYDEKLPAFDYIVQSVDPAYTEKTTNDPSAFQAWGVFTKNKRKGVMLLDAWADHLAYPDLRQKLIDEWHSTYGKNGERVGKKADILLIEAKASGLSIIQDLRQANLPAMPYNPGTADKINRAHQAAPILEMGCLWIPESQKERGQPATWAREFLKVLKAFPHGRHDDEVDAFSQCMIYLRDSRMLEMPEAELDEMPYEKDYDRPHGRPQHYVNPYAA
jgi:predicted phage terminase large subunit-like protein